MATTTVQQAEAAHEPLFATAYLRSLWGDDYARFRGSDAEASLLERLRAWAAKHRQKETVAEGSFVDVFFKQIWGYRASGQGKPGEGYTLHPQYPVRSAGERGGMGKADLALGYFGLDDREAVPQVLGELKDDRSGLDKEQSRSNRRSPVDQCFDYLREARSGRVSKLLPTWAFVSDMNEFRLYIYGNKAQYQRFVLEPSAGDPAIPLLADTEEASFQRFVFSRVFHTDWLLSTAGKSPLEKLLGEQLTRERALEADFYKEFQAYRERLFAVLRDHNPQFAEQGRLRKLVGLTQRLLDRFIFVLYCEDMGRQLSFPPNVLRDVLIEVAASRFYNPSGTQAWDQLRALFVAMRDGGPFGADRIHKFNGGLFADEPELEGLRVPNEIFCAQHQGESPERLLGAPLTLLFFASKYNFGAASDGSGKTLTLTAMGRIFEQSITDLELMEARAAGRESLTEITKRKRDGVYYTPEWVTKYIVEETVGERLAEIRTELGFDRLGPITDAQIADSRKDARRAPVVKEYVKALHAYSERLDLLKVVDPACGSGAFLIQVFQYLYAQRQWVAAELERATGTRSLFDTHEAMRAVLAHNLYGVDINAESVEITRLALWLHTALPDRPLTSLDRNIRCGNSLVEPDFATQLGLDPASVSTDRLERVNPFDWREAFPEVFERADGGFDCVVGNPPYVKLQNFRRVLEDVALYLVQAKKSDGSARYESTQTGNFDLYLPFIERGVELLSPKGKLGYIAPSVWLVNEYGEGLRRFVKSTRSLDRWIDFKAFQVFDEAMTYTALQFFAGSARAEARCVFAPRGAQDLRAAPWDKPHARVDVGVLDTAGAWELVADNEAGLWKKLQSSCMRLDEACEQIAVGVQTSADSIYHLTKLGPGKYLRWPGAGADPVEVALEDEIMRPLVSGPEANRYQRPTTELFLLFPYRVAGGRVELLPAGELASKLPRAWRYLSGFEQELRKREGGKFDDDQWYRFGRNQNIDKQHLPKLCVPQTVPSLRVANDSEGAVCINNVRVNGILTDTAETSWFLLGILNAKPADFVFRRISKPKAGGYYEANKQFIAPLPVPRATPEQKAEVAKRAELLQDLHTRRRDLLTRLDKRLASSQCEDDVRDEVWIWADVKPAKTLAAEAPAGLAGREKTAWAKAERERRLRAHLDGLDTMLQAGARLSVDCAYGELRLLVDGVPAIDGLFISDAEAPFLSAQWRHAVRDTNVTEAFDGKKLLRKLLQLRRTDNAALREQVIQLDTDIAQLDRDIDAAERAMNDYVYELYGLSEEEIRLVEAG